MNRNRQSKMKEQRIPPNHTFDGNRSDATKGKPKVEFSFCSIRTILLFVLLHVLVMDVVHSTCSNGRAFYIAVLSAPLNIERRETWRSSCGAVLRMAGMEYQFIIGRVSMDSSDPSGHVQGLKATMEEQSATLQLMKEAETEKDIKFSAGREYYRDTTDKLLQIFEHGYADGARFIAKVDDDTCPDIQSLLELEASDIYDNDGERMTYAGNYLFNGDEYEQMKGPHNETSKFYAGPHYVLSRNLVKSIIIDHRINTYSYEYYGTSSEDANVGKWVAHVQERFPNATIDFGKARWKSVDEISSTGIVTSALPPLPLI